MHAPVRTVPALLPAGLRAAIGAAAAVNLVAAAAFITAQPWAVGAWPWETGRLSHLFVASMLAAVGTGAAWIAASGEAGSLPAGFLNLAVTLGGIAVFLFSGRAEVAPAGWLGGVVALLAIANAVLFWLTKDVRVQEPRPLPRLLRGSYVVFSTLLVVVGIALILRMDGVMPWPLDDDTSVVLGWMFFGDAWFFAYAVVRPHWQRARAQLWSFLGYSAVLLVPLTLHLRNVDAALLPNLLLYLAVLAYSAALGVYYLVVNPRTRGWAPR